MICCTKLAENHMPHLFKVYDACSVVGRKRRNSDNYEAVAFIVKTDQTGDEEKIVEDLADLCGKSVPTYMITVEYRFVDELPHTPIGKVDFRNLERMAAKEIL